MKYTECHHELFHCEIGHRCEETKGKLSVRNVEKFSVASEFAQTEEKFSLESVNNVGKVS